ncbi:MAG: ribose-phosphate diphosphokinase [Candidatus Hodarchaeales archaeon]|jgi:ribose-phosphate pyrophosphokinase
MTIINLSSLNLAGIKPKIVHFHNKEFKIVFDDLPEDKKYIIIVQTDKNPVKMIFVTAMIVDIVKKNNPTHIIVVHPWLSFSRQDKRFLPLEPLTLDLILKWYHTLGVTDLISFDIHAIQFRKSGIHEWKKKMRIHNVNFVSSFYKPGVTIMSPTDEQEPFLEKIEEKTGNIIYFKKEKFCENCGNAQQECKCEGNFSQKVVLTPLSEINTKKALLLDDIISGGNTMLEAVNSLRNHGVSDISIAITHGFFDGVAANEIFDLVSSVTISNTLQIKEEIRNKHNVKIMNIEENILDYINKNFL